MSADEDTELRDLVAQSLESKGVLGKIKAQLRASVFLVLDEQEGAENKIPLSNPNLKKFLNTNEGRLVAGLVREFLEFFDLDFTIAVFDPESNFNDRYQGRNNLANELKLNDVDKLSNVPILLEVVQRMLQGGSNAAKQPPASSTQSQAKSSSWQNGPVSPRSTSPSSSGKKPSKIPQLIKDDRPRSTSHSIGSENGLDHVSDRKNDHKIQSLSDSKPDHHGRGSPDRTIGSDDDDIFAEFMSKQKPSYQSNKSKKDSADSSPLDKSDSGPKLSSLKGAPSLGASGLGSLKDAPPLSSSSRQPKDQAKSPDWRELADIDNKIHKLGFDMPSEDKSNQEYDYEDDFQPSSSHISEHSLTEEIEEQLSSYHSNSSRVNDLLTTDMTVSHASDSGLDYAEDVLDDF